MVDGCRVGASCASQVRVAEQRVQLTSRELGLEDLCAKFLKRFRRFERHLQREVLKARKRAQKGSICSLVKVPSSEVIRDTKPPYTTSVSDVSLKPSVPGIAEMLALPTHVILDFARVTFMDGCSVNVLKQLKRDYDTIDVRLFIASCSDSVFNFLDKGGAVELLGSDAFFPSIFDAVRAAIHPEKCIGAIKEPQDGLPEMSAFL